MTINFSPPRILRCCCSQGAGDEVFLLLCLVFAEEPSKSYSLIYCARSLSSDETCGLYLSQHKGYPMGVGGWPWRICVKVKFTSQSIFFNFPATTTEEDSFSLEYIWPKYRQTRQGSRSRSGREGTEKLNQNTGSAVFGAEGWHSVDGKELESPPINMYVWSYLCGSAFWSDHSPNNNNERIRVPPPKIALL